MTFRLPLILTILFYILVCIPENFAQTSMRIHAGAALPLADFGNDDINAESAAGAHTGFTSGIQYMKSLNDSGLALVIGADVMYNGLDETFKDVLKDVFGENNIDPFYKYVNIPVFAGLNYTFNPNSPVAIYATAGAGIDFMYLTKMKIRIGNDEGFYNFDSSTSFGFNAGAGLRFNDKLSLNFLYSYLGTQTLDGEVEFGGDTQELDATDIDVTIATITAGYSF